MVSTGQEMFREKSGNFKCSESGKISSLKEVREKGSFKTTYVFFSLYLRVLFSNILKSFCTFYGHESCCIGRLLFIRLNDKLCQGVM